MATRKLEISDEAIQQAAALLSEDTFSTETLNPALETLYAELGMTDGGEATVHVTKLNADGRGAEANIWRGPPDDYDLERLAKQFGSGDYRVKVYVRIPSGQKVLKGNKVFTWLLSPEEETKRQNPQSSVIPQTNPVDMARMIAEAVRAAIPQPAPQIDTMTQMRQFAEIMALMRPEPIQAPQHDPMAIMERVLQMQTMMRESMPERDDAPVSGGANTNDLLLGLIKSFGPMFAQVMAQQGAGQMGEMPQEVHAPQITHNQQPAAPQAVIPQPSQTSEENDVSVKLKMGINFLVMQCDAGGAPETYADVVLDSVPEDFLQSLVDSSQAIELLAQYDKRVMEPQRRPWFEALFKEIKEVMSLPEEGEDNVQAT